MNQIKLYNVNPTTLFSILQTRSTTGLVCRRRCPQLLSSRSAASRLRSASKTTARGSRVLSPRRCPFSIVTRASGHLFFSLSLSLRRATPVNPSSSRVPSLFSYFPRIQAATSIPAGLIAF